ncbi:putative NADH-flavin reductase [Pedobacter cryoconitis]|uniref:Putative NADH-flavin reductase n=1 Tax=Pedobacter cryoconitis TaxID=188932 RepID=A0A7W9DZK0_9SPHI|nr:NAD(P)H-binding protein [Pedobacter cryoconitis]MBB5637103.1 putative NADH-flavin reductase [Pedobacter cryoconitis]
MKVLVFGANGKTGRLVVDRAIASGHEVTVLVRHASLSFPASVRVIVGDALKIMDVRRAMNCQEAVIECIGGNAPWMAQTLERNIMHNIVTLMEESGARLLLVVSAMGVAESKSHSSWWYRLLVLPTFLRGVIADKTAMETIVRQSQMDWVIARPPILTDGTATAKVRVLGKTQTGHVITRADLAVWLVEQLETKTYIRQALTIVNS